ncbi:Sensor protein FixL [compost metagenome]
MRQPELLGSVLAEARELLTEEALQRNVRMEIQSVPGLPPVSVDRVQIQQVFINLVRNAFDALETVSPNRILKVRASLLDDFVQIEITDNGIGIQNLDRIFEPFFTTKEQGMGMGLAICRSIIESHGGRLWAENVLPIGARFTFTLPMLVDERSAA